MKEETTPTIEDVLKKHVRDSQWYSHVCDNRIKAAMTEWEQITSAPLLAKIEELEKEIIGLKEMVSSGLNSCEQFQSSLKEKESKCESDHVSIDDLLSEFDRRGFNTSNWDGDAEAPEAIVSGVKNHINELEESLKEKEKECEELKTSGWKEGYIKQSKQIEELKAENERLKGLVKTQFFKYYDDAFQEHIWEEYAKENNL